MSPDRIRLEVTNNLAALPPLVEAVRSYLAQWQLDKDDIADLLVILDELVSNVVRHAWTDGAEHRFIVELDAEPLSDGMRMTLRVEDDGIAFNPTRVRPDTTALLDDGRPAGGFGVQLLAALADRIDYQYHNGRNCLSVTKRAGLRVSPRAS